jgi:hypothetical protein
MYGGAEHCGGWNAVEASSDMGMDGTVKFIPGIEPALVLPGRILSYCKASRPGELGRIVVLVECDQRPPFGKATLPRRGHHTRA